MSEHGAQLCNKELCCVWCSCRVVGICVCARVHVRLESGEGRQDVGTSDEHFGDEIITEISTIWCRRNWFSAIDGF